MYEKTIEACLRREASQWDIGDALIEECGKPGKDGVKDDSHEKIKEVSKVLESKGIDYSVKTLLIMRATASAWEGVTRITPCSWSVYKLFNENQKLLRDWIKKNPETVLTVVAAKEILQKEKERQEKKEQKAAEAEAEEAKAAAEAEDTKADNDETTPIVSGTFGETMEGNVVIDSDNTDTQYVPDEEPALVSEEVANEVEDFKTSGEDLWAATTNLSEYLKDNDIYLNDEADKIIEMIENVREAFNKLLPLVRKRRSSKPRVAVDNTTNVTSISA